MDKMTVLLLFGGISTEHEVSCISAASVAEHIDPARYVYHAAGSHFYEMTPLGVTKGNAADEVRALYGGKEQCLLFTAGDAGSDTAMAPVSDLFFVPQSAPERVRSFADRLIPSPVDGGIAEAIAAAQAYK